MLKFRLLKFWQFIVSLSKGYCQLLLKYVERKHVKEQVCYLFGKVNHLYPILENFVDNLLLLGCLSITKSSFTKKYLKSKCVVIETLLVQIYQVL